MAEGARVREKDAVDLVRGNGGADGIAGYYGLGVDGGDKMPESGEERVVEVGLCEGEEDDAAKGVAEGDEVVPIASLDWGRAFCSVMMGCKG